MSKVRILFYSDDFKTESWQKELNKLDCEVVSNSADRLKYFHNILYHARVLIDQFFNKKKIDVFVFRYLNDNQHLRVSLEYLFRDLITVVLCTLMGTKMIWLLHNIDKETKVRHPLISKLRRKIVGFGCNRILVTDPHLIEFALEYGIEKDKLDWICFGEPEKKKPDKRNQVLKEKIKSFKENLSKEIGIKNIIVGLCVSEPAKKKSHYLFADSVAGRLEDAQDSCLVLVMIGSFPNGVIYDEAKEKVNLSPYVLHIDEAFLVNEHYISDEIDFFYRSMTDHSVAYTLYVACSLGKPTVTHNTGALPVIIQRENIGFVLEDNYLKSSDMFNAIKGWNSEGNLQFLTKRSWQIGAERLMENISKIVSSP